MSGRGSGRGGPAFSGRTSGHRITSLQARDAGQGGGRGRGKYKKTLNGNYIANRDDGNTSKEESNAKLLAAQAEDKLDAELGFPLFTSGDDKLGWLMNMQPSVMLDKDTGQVASAVDCYFMCQDGSMFKARMPFAPYFYVQVTDGSEHEVEGFMRRKYDGLIKEIEVVDREDLDLKNHLSGIKRKLLKLSFHNVQQLLEVRREVAPAIGRNKARARTTQAYQDMAMGLQQQGEGLGEGGSGRGGAGGRDLMDCLMDMREYDVPYHVRFAIDKDIRCAHWFTVKCKDGVTSMTHRADLLQRAEPRICAWDIETTKLPLQFPNAEYDQVFMISYMLDRQGYLITNREVVGGDIDPFEFTPKPEYDGPFQIFNEANEEALLKRFFNHMREVKPAIYVTYNGDFFDFPFVEKRCKVYGMDMYEQLGFKITTNGEVLARHAVHMDCLHWVNRDSYLPQGSRGLKAVTKAKLGYDPVEVNPEEMLPMARDQPQAMASYSVSDAVSTYYLYMTYIHPFIFSLATIIPMPPDDVLRKGSGTLCEQLLMVQAFAKGIVCPNKHASQSELFYKGHLLDSETYIGGKVEAIESGVFRADLPLRFRCTSSAYQGLIERLDKDLGYAITNEGKMKMEDIDNYEEVKAAITEKLASLRDTPVRDELPLIYHLDVAAMYPNIILTNRLQPSATVTDEDCAACVFNTPDKNCLRQMEWVWRGEHFAADRNEYLAIKNQLQSETFAPAPVPPAAVAAAAARGDRLAPGQPRTWDELSQEEKDKLLRDRLKKYTQKVYKRILDKPIQELRVAGICQRENSFYVDTVRAFRDRRYEYKGLNKVWKGKLDSAKKEGDPLKTVEAADMVVLYDSLQLAHKCILNSFYGYVMRKGARWYSMEMAGVVTNTGAKIIQQACALVTALGRPLELDTDGIWCALPASFPEDYKFKNKNGKVFKISYPCVMLNVMVADHNTNPQYQTLVDPVTRAYQTTSEMSIEFEVDGPYKAMILPASKEEGKSIKKRYAVFNFDGSLAELKGFEVKRRGELKLIKVFQSEVFSCFLAGTTLEQCYAAVAAVANRWLDMLDTQGTDLTDEELIDYISEATTMSKGLEEYEGRKSCPITCAKRLGQFLGNDRIKDKGLNCQYVIARKPEQQPTSERAIPVSIFSAEPAVARTYLRQWCGDVGSAPSHCVPDVRDIVDWDYYRERLGSAIQKIITIPAAMQGVPNPAPRVKHPDWLQRKVASLSSRCHQQSMKGFVTRIPKKTAADKASADVDMEDAVGGVLVPTHKANNNNKDTANADVGDDDDEEGGLVVGGGGNRSARRARRQAVVIGDEDDEQQGQGQGPDAAANRENVAPRAGGAGKVPQKDAKQQQQAQKAAAAPKPKIEDGYKSWMEHQKAQWKQAREQRKRRKTEAAAAAKAAQRAGAGHGGAGGAAAAGVLPSLGPARGDVGLMFKQQAAAITQVPWQVVHVAETHVPGKFKVWFLANNSIHSIHLKVPRIFYVDSEEPLDLDQITQQAMIAAKGAGLPGGVSFTQGGSTQPSTQLQIMLAGLRDARLVKAASKQLPGGRKARHLYQIEMSEEQFLSQTAVLSAVLSAPHIVSVYEDRLPLAMTAALAIGSITKLTPAAANKPLQADFQISDFKAPTSSGVKYLEAPAKNSSAGNGRLPLLGQINRPSATPRAGDGVETPSGPLGPHLKHLLLYCSGDSNQGRSLACLYMPTTAKVVVVVVITSVPNAAKDVNASVADRLWKDTAAQVCPDEQPAKLSWQVEYVRDNLDAGRVIQRALGQHRSETKGRSLCVVQAPVPWSSLAASWLPALNDTPCMDLPARADDSRYPALQWQVRAVRRALVAMLHSSANISERAAMARFAGVPVSSLGCDVIVSAWDLQLARSLHSSDHLLWAKDPALPDLGVEDKDDADAQLSCLVAGLGAVITDPTPAGTGPAGQGMNGGGGPQGGAAGGRPGWSGTSPELLAPGAYRSVCVELKVDHLAVAALMQAEALGDLEGAASVEGAGGAAGPAFKVLKAQVATWLNEATVNENILADAQLRSLYRWLSNPASALYDPALHRALQGLMAKLFAQLVAEMRKLGAVLVCANFNTIIIATGKTELSTAVGYIKYLLEALKRRDMFWLVDLRVSHCWHALLYRDRYNWAGITAEETPDENKAGGGEQQQQQPSELHASQRSKQKSQKAATQQQRRATQKDTDLETDINELEDLEDASEDIEMHDPEEDVQHRRLDGRTASTSGRGRGDHTQQQGNDDEEQDDAFEIPGAGSISLSFQWNLANFLPPALKEALEDVMLEYIYQPWKHAHRKKRKANKSAASGQGQADGPAANQTDQEQEAGGSVSDQQLAWIQEALPNSITQSLLQIVQEAARTMPVGSEVPEHQFPQLAGSHLTAEELGSPALGFVRVVCTLLGLDGRLSGEVAVLRRQLLRCLHVREFSRAAEFKELCMALIVPDVICTCCNECRDLDLCRDERLNAQGKEGSGWTCETCGHPYDMSAMERRLVSALQQHIRDYQLQDLQCVRCRAVSSSHLTSGCSRCGANLTTTTAPSAFRKKLTVFSSVAKHHNFPVLEQLAAWVLEMP